MPGRTLGKRTAAGLRPWIVPPRPQLPPTPRRCGSRMEGMMPPPALAAAARRPRPPGTCRCSQASQRRPTRSSRLCCRRTRRSCGASLGARSCSSSQAACCCSRRGHPAARLRDVSAAVGTVRGGWRGRSVPVRAPSVARQCGAQEPRGHRQTGLSTWVFIIIIQLVSYTHSAIRAARLDYAPSFYHPAAIDPIPRPYQ